MTSNYRDMAVPQLSLASSRRLPKAGELIPTRDTPTRELSITSSRYTNNTNGSRVQLAENTSTYNVQRNISSKLSLGGTLGQYQFGSIESNMTFLQQPQMGKPNNDRLNCNPYMAEKE